LRDIYSVPAGASVLRRAKVVLTIWFARAKGGAVCVPPEAVQVSGQFRGEVNVMRFSLLPKEFQFFTLFDKQASWAVEAARFFKELAVSGKFDDDNIQRMHDIEHKCDEVTHEIIYSLNKTFITPFDREDIHSLAHELDTVVDIIHTIIKRMRLYKLTTSNPELVQFAEVIEKSVAALARAVSGLRHLKHTQEVMENCIEINRLENVGDQLRDQVIGGLFENNQDAISIIKWKEIYQDAETVLDQCEDVANVVESILVKQA
jgi:hypothetical protein